MQRTAQRRDAKSRRKPPHGPRGIIARATSLLSQGAYRRALKLLRAALVQHTVDPAMLTRYADALYLTGRIAQAREIYGKALALDSELFQAWYGRGFAELCFEAYAAAIPCFRRAVELQPEDWEARSYLGKALYHMGEVDAAISELGIAAKCPGAKWRRRALRQIAVIIPGSPTRGNAEILKARRKWARLEEQVERAPRSRPSRCSRQNSRLRVGYVSAFFAARNWMKPVWGTIHAHDRSAFEIHLFLDGAIPGAGSGFRRQAGDRIHVLTGLSNQAAAERVAAAGIDVLVDLNGYSFPERLGLFMRKPAARIVGWFNMYATTAISSFDYIIGDASVIPASEERYYTERVLRVAGSYLSFSVLYPVPPVSPPPCLRAGHITFGCLAPQYKITDEVIAVWAEILRAAPATRLLLKNSCLGDPANRNVVLARFARHGISEERLLAEGPAEHYEFLRAYGRMDIALDTFPYNGGTTTMEALWQGVPVLTFNGDRWASRTSRSLLVNAGLDSWVMQTQNSYIKRAIELALAPESSAELRALREGMRNRLLRSPVCDTAALSKELERAYREIAEAKRASSLRDEAPTTPQSNLGCRRAES